MNVEVEIERAKETADEYGKMCLESAYKAYKSLMDDGHSGLSFSITRSILKRLLYEIPLSPITEDDFKGIEPIGFLCHDGCVTRQCPRRGGLFQDTYPDGHVEYHDNDRCTMIDEVGNGWHFGLASRVINQRHPITMPYVPTENPYIVHGCSFMHDPKTCRVWIERGSYTFTYLECYEEPNGRRHRLDLLFEETDDGVVEVKDNDRKRLLLKNMKPVIKESKRLHRQMMEECK